MSINKTCQSSLTNEWQTQEILKDFNMYFENEIWDQYVDKNSKIGSR